jgi:type II secretory pathway pseudopilin PulG
MHHRRRNNAAFTLVELMISVFMVVLLMIGINMVFKLASDTVGVGQRTIAIQQDIRSLESTMEDDTKRWLTDAPAFVIVNERFVDAAGIAHRRDYFAFPARGVYHRQTARNFSSYVSPTGSYESWIWYGSTLPLSTAPNPANPLTNATVPTDVVGRVAILLKDQSTLNVNAPAGNLENFILRNTASLPLSPLGSNSVATNKNGGDAQRFVQESIYDLAGTTLDTFKQDLFAEATRSPNTWWQNLTYRFQCSSKLSKPMTPVSVSQMSPYFVGNCSQFVVEFAGDYLDQKNYNSPQLGQDGQIDYDLDTSVSPNRTKIRWYGLARDTVGDGSAAVLPASLTPYFQRDLFDNGNSANKYKANGRYVCVWANEAPKLIRVSIKLEDPTGRIQDGPWCEFVLGPQ